jgi:hypothetical protein
MLLGESQTQGDLWRDLFILVIGALLGGLLSLFLERARIWWRRKVVSRALIPYLSGCCNQAKALARILASDMIPNWQKGRCATYGFRAFDTSLWEALLQDPDQLTGKYWTVLVGFHTQIASVRFVLDFLQQAQVAFVEANHAGNQEAATAIRQRVLEYAEKAKQDCELLAGFVCVADLDEFAKQWSDSMNAMGTDLPAEASAKAETRRANTQS